jgi:hypothetical protein
MRVAVALFIWRGGGARAGHGQACDRMHGVLATHLVGTFYSYVYILSPPGKGCVCEGQYEQY